MQKEYEDLINESKKYLELRYDKLRLELLKKLSLIIGVLLIFFVATILGLIVVTYCSVLLLEVLKTAFGSMIPGLLIVIGIHLVALICVFVFRKQWFINPLIKQFSKIIFSNDIEQEEAENASTATIVDDPVQQEGGTV